MFYETTLIYVIVKVIGCSFDKVHVLKFEVCLIFPILVYLA